MKYNVRLKPKVEKQIEALDSYHYARVMTMLALLEYNPFLGKKLKGEFRGFYAVRVWPYRIIYLVIKNELLVYITRVSHRQSTHK